MSFCFKAMVVFSLVLGTVGVQADTAESKIKKIEISLNLSAEQVKKINAIKEKYSTQMKEQDAATCLSRVALQEAFKSSQKGADFQKVLQDKFMQYRDAKSAEKLTGFKMAMEIREILNTEQIIKFNDIHNPGKVDPLQCGSSSKL